MTFIDPPPVFHGRYSRIFFDIRTHNPAFAPRRQACESLPKVLWTCRATSRQPRLPFGIKRLD
jgi:hypothetical protein